MVSFPNSANVMFRYPNKWNKGRKILRGFFFYGLVFFHFFGGPRGPYASLGITTWYCCLQLLRADESVMLVHID